MEFYSALKMKAIQPFATWMKLENIMLIKPERERQILCGITYIWYLDKKKKAES